MENVLAAPLALHVSLRERSPVLKVAERAKGFPRRWGGDAGGWVKKVASNGVGQILVRKVCESERVTSHGII